MSEKSLSRELIKYGLGALAVTGLTFNSAPAHSQEFNVNLSGMRDAVANYCDSNAELREAGALVSIGDAGEEGAFKVLCTRSPRFSLGIEPNVNNFERGSELQEQVDKYCKEFPTDRVNLEVETEITDLIQLSVSCPKPSNTKI
jgi:hypothetical protein